MNKATKKLKIRFNSASEALAQFEADWKDLDRRKKPSRVVATGEPLLMMDYSMFTKVFSPERLRIIRTIQEKRPNSVSELADLLGREQANVHRDVHYLADLGILELSRVKHAGRPEIVRPEFNWVGFDIDLPPPAKKNPAA